MKKEVEPIINSIQQHFKERSDQHLANIEVVLKLTMENQLKVDAAKKIQERMDKLKADTREVQESIKTTKAELDTSIQQYSDKERKKADELKTDLEKKRQEQLEKKQTMIQDIEYTLKDKELKAAIEEEQQLISKLKTKNKEDISELQKRKEQCEKYLRTNKEETEKREQAIKPQKTYMDYIITNYESTCKAKFESDPSLQSLKKQQADYEAKKQQLEAQIQTCQDFDVKNDSNWKKKNAETAKLTRELQTIKDKNENKFKNIIQDFDTQIEKITQQMENVAKSVCIEEFEIHIHIVS